MYRSWDSRWRRLKNTWVFSKMFCKLRKITTLTYQMLAQAFVNAASSDPKRVRLTGQTTHHPRRS